MVKYRDHKGGLAEAMKTVIEVSSIDEIKAHLNESWNQFGKTVEEIKFRYVGYDDRIDWETFYVLQRFKGETEFTVAGMSNGEFETELLDISNHADFVFNIVGNYLIIIDSNLGHKSVTNDFEYVLREINYIQDITNLEVFYYNFLMEFSQVFPEWDGKKCINVKFNKND